ncbi:hypothetical protein BDFB_006000 [Asbolus verrucosus]|uniref:Uncharacterized protein n=1 Tax=Asbolus verrucosus TaxID=1661398 RepID=A0A482WBH3_ASBVE|nr:hypothetical protein BDFB_006000 [Asbolus verrucosus]
MSSPLTVELPTGLSDATKIRCHQRLPPPQGLFVVLISG